MSSTNTTDSSRGLKLYDWIELVSNAAIPLMIGVICLWLAIHQQNITQTNREQDIEHANQLRQQDLQLARLQRDEDKDIARLQREEDREIARSERELDLNITYVKRMQDYEVAEKERNLSEILRTSELEINYRNRIQDLIYEDNRQKQSVLIEYQDNLAVLLLLDYNLIKQQPSSDAWFILQMKTEAALRQLDSVRRTILVRSLVEAKIFDTFVKDHQSVFLKVNLTGVEFGESLHLYTDDVCTLCSYLNIIESDLRYASFRSMSLSKLPSFALSNFDYTDWSFTKLTNVCFCHQMTLNHAIFTHSYLMNNISFENNQICSNCGFLQTSMSNIRLENSTFFQSIFIDLTISDANLRYIVRLLTHLLNK